MNGDYHLYFFLVPICHSRDFHDFLSPPRCPHCPINEIDKTIGRSDLCHVSNGKEKILQLHVFLQRACGGKCSRAGDVGGGETRRDGGDGCGCGAWERRVDDGAVSAGDYDSRSQLFGLSKFV